MHVPSGVASIQATEAVASVKKNAFPIDEMSKASCRGLRPQTPASVIFVLKLRLWYLE